MTTIEEFYAIRGAGGGSKGGEAPEEEPDNLFAKSYARVLYLIGEGAIAGPADSDILKCIYLDDVPIKDSDGELNFEEGFKVEFRYGTQDQRWVGGFPSVEAETEVGIKVTKVDPVVRALTDVNADACKVRLMVPALQKQEDDGDLTETEIRYRIEISAKGRSYKTYISDKLRGKTTSPFQWEHRIALPGEGPWQIRVVRETDDSDSVKRQNELYWQAFTSIIETKFRYPNSALLGLRFNAEQFRSIPKVSMLLKGINDLRIPHNYDPETRRYSGAFNGSLVPGFTDNPAWIFYALVTNPRYGCGKFIAESQVDIWSLYAIARYCDELVDNGFGRREPRFTCNCYIQSREDAYQILNTLASVFRGMLYWASGAVYAVQDAPSSPVRIYTEANVVQEVDDQGRVTKPPFVYSGSSRKARHTVVLVSYSDRNDNYRTKVEYVEDQEGIERYGYNQTEITAFGCTTRGQAHRAGKWLLLSERLETETITFSVGSEGLLVRPGEIIEVADPSRAGRRMGGRIVSATATQITLDAPVQLQNGISYTLSTVRSQGVTQEHQVLNGAGSTSVLQVGAIADIPPPGSVWVLSGTNLVPQQFRVVSIVEQAEHIYEITGTKHNPGKFDAIEKDIALTELPISVLPNPARKPKPPGKLDVRELLYTNTNSSGVKIKALLTWQRSPSAFVAQYQVEMRSPGSANFKQIASTRDLSIEALDLKPGIYQFRVRAVSSVGNPSKYVTETQEFYGRPVRPRDVEGFELQPMPNEMVLLKWERSRDLSVRLDGFYVIRHTTELKPGLVNWAQGIKLAGVNGNTTQITVPQIAGTYMIKAVDAVGTQSRNAALRPLRRVIRRVEQGVVQPASPIPPEYITITATSAAQDYDAIETLQESPNFTGNGSNTTVDRDRGVLKISAKDSFDSQPGLFDDYPGDFDDVTGYFDQQDGNFDDAPGDFDDLGLTYSINSDGMYEFSNPVSLGGIFDSYISARVGAIAVDETATFDRTGGLFDDAPGEFDGEDIDDSSATLQIATSQDGISYSDWQEFITGSYTGWAYKFRVWLQSGDANHNIEISDLRVDVDVPERTETGDLITSAAGTTVSFTNPFRRSPVVGVTIFNALSGDYYQVTGVTATQFTIRVFTAAGTGVARQVTWLAKGFGRKELVTFVS